jgi:hypothetical protein
MDREKPFRIELIELCRDSCHVSFYDDNEIAAIGFNLIVMLSFVMGILSRGSVDEAVNIIDNVFNPALRTYAENVPVRYTNLKMDCDKWREKELAKKAN